MEISNYLIYEMIKELSKNKALNNYNITIENTK